jgi:hypothetical protein
MPEHPPFTVPQLISLQRCNGMFLALPAADLDTVR